MLVYYTMIVYYTTEVCSYASEGHAACILGVAAR